MFDTDGMHTEEEAGYAKHMHKNETQYHHHHHRDYHPLLPATNILHI